MNSHNTVLNRIMTLLSLDTKEEVKFTFARLADGTLVESPTFDVGESVDVIGEDGIKTPAPDGEHELELKDSEDNVTRIKIFTEGGVITERENVELEESEETEELAEETIEVQPLPQTTDEPEANKVEAEEEVEDEKEIEINLEEVAEKVEKMAYRIDELEKQLQDMQVEEEEKVEEEMEEEDESNKLDGAPVEASKFSSQSKKPYSIKNYQGSVLGKMYR